MTIEAAGKGCADMLVRKVSIVDQISRCVAQRRSRMPQDKKVCHDAKEEKEKKKMMRCWLASTGRLDV